MILKKDECLIKMEVSEFGLNWSLYTGTNTHPTRATLFADEMWLP